MTDTHHESRDLGEVLPDKLVEADPEEIDWERLARVGGGSLRGTYTLPTDPDGNREDWVDRLAIIKDAARHVERGGEIPVEEVLIDG